MAGWKTDPSYFFGARSTEFVVDVGDSEGSKNRAIPMAHHGNNLKLQNHNRSTNNLDDIKILDGSEGGTKVKLELSSIPEKIVPGKPVTLVLNVKRADNGTLVTHPDALVTISGASSKLLESGPPGNPVIPINGAFHGHSGEKVITTVFPSTGTYTIDMDVNSIPVSNYMFGHVKTSFDVNVSDADDSRSIGTGTGPSQVTNASTTTAIPVTNELNHVAIIGQDAPYYNPDRITINPGTTLTFRNHDAVIHTVTGTDDGITVVSPTANNSFDTGILQIGQEKQITFAKAGTYNYFCAVHPFMRGIVSVMS